MLYEVAALVDPIFFCGLSSRQSNITYALENMQTIRTRVCTSVLSEPALEAFLISSVIIYNVRLMKSEIMSHAKLFPM